MQRRDFCASACLTVAATAGLAPQAVWAQAAAPQAGVDYVKLRQSAPVDAPAGQIEVLEFFWYSCPHCHSFDPVLSQWAARLPADVAFKRLPIAFSDSYRPQQQLFFALQAMGLLDKLHARFFAAIHTERQRLLSVEAITDWVVAQGVDKAAFGSHLNSFTTASKVRRADQIMAAYQLDGVPALGVAGRFYTDGAKARGMDRVLQVADFLLAEVRVGR